jgi:hypothetical protein
VQFIVDRSGFGSRSRSWKPPGTGIAGPDGGEELPVMRVATSLPWVVTGSSARLHRGAARPVSQLCVHLAQCLVAVIRDAV